jgi:hypothetical protein
MQRRTALATLSAVSASLLLAAAAAPAGAVSNEEKKFVGSWTSPISTSYGDNARGLLIFSADGRYQLSIQRAVLPKVASNNRTKATPQEEHAIVEGSINHFGRYTIDHKKNILTLNIEGSTFPNWIGTSQQRSYTIKNGVLTYKVTAASGTGQPGETSWRRAK